MSPLKVVFILQLGISVVKCATILCAFPVPGYSHQMIYRLLINELAKRGHELTVITGNTFVDNLEPSIRVVDAGPQMKIATDSNHRVFKPYLNAEGGQNSICYNELLVNIDDAVFGSPQVQSFLRENNTFDLVIAEYASPVAVILKEHYNCPLLLFSPTILKDVVHVLFGNDYHPVAHPIGVLASSDWKDLSLWERIKSTIFLNCIHLCIHISPFKAQKEKYFPRVKKSMKQIINEADLLVYVDLPGLSLSRAHAQNIIPIGPVHIDENLVLDQEMQIFMDNSPRGVILVSLGTNIHLNELPVGQRDIFLRELEKVPYQILIKCDEPNFKLPKNIYWKKWVAQQALLKHPNLKLFINHGGFQSTIEAVYYAKPIIALPFYVDQFGNADLIHKAQIGIKLKFRELQLDQLKNAVELILVPNESVYVKKITKLSKLLKDRPINGLDHFVWLVEFLIRNNGSQHLVCPSRSLPFYLYYNLDVYFIILLLFYVLFKASLFVLKINI